MYIPKNKLQPTCLALKGVHRGNYLEGELVRRTEVEARVGKLKNRTAAHKDEITGPVGNYGHRIISRCIAMLSEFVGGQ